MPAVGFAVAGAIGITSPLGVAAVQLAGSLLLSAAARALMPKPDYAGGQVRGQQVSSRQPVAPRELVYGETRKGGTIAFMHSSEAGYSGAPPNAELHMIIVIAAHEVEKIGAIYFNGAEVIADGESSGNAGHAYCERYLGTPGQVPSDHVVERTGGLWSKQHRLAGCAYIYVRLLFSPDHYPTGLPNITCDVMGKNDILDPRTGTRGFTDNAALCVADYMSLAPFGIGAQIGSDDGTNQATLIAQANVCDEIVDEADGSTDRRYRCNGVVTLDQAPKTIIEAMLTSMSGQAAWQAGQWHLYAGAYRTPTLSFSSDDFAGDIQLQTRVSRQENFNGVRGQFISPENDWQPDDFPAYQSAAYVTEDGEEEAWDDMSLPFTISANAAQRLAKIRLEQKRRQQRVRVPGKLKMWRATVGNVIYLNYDRYGFAAKPFEVKGMTLAIQDGALIPELILQETSPLVYDHTANEFQIYAAAPTTTLPSAFDVASPRALAFNESLYQTRTGGLKNQVRIEWVAADSIFVTQYQVEASADGVTWEILGSTSGVFFDALDWPSGDWWFRVKSISTLGVSSPYAAVQGEVFGLAAPPADISNLTIQAAGGSAILKWDQTPDLDVVNGGRIIIRHSASLSPSWSNSVSMDIVAGSQAIAVVPLKPGTYLVRAEDSTGNKSENAATVNASGAQIVAVANITTLTADPTFSGTKTNVVESGGVLFLDSGSDIDSWADFDAVENFDAEGGVLPNGTYEFATVIDLATVKSVRLRSEIELSVESILDQIDDRSGDIDTWLDFDGVDGSEVDVWIEVRTTDDDPSGSPVWGPWGRIDSSEVQCRGIDARAVLVSSSPDINLNISKLRLTADEAA